MGCLIVAAAALIPWVSALVTWAWLGWGIGVPVMWAAGINLMANILVSCYRWDVDHGA